MALVIPVGPTVRIVVPVEPVVIVITLPDDLAADLRRQHIELVADHARMGFKEIPFDTWVKSVLRDRVSGDGHPWPEERS